MFFINIEMINYFFLSLHNVEFRPILVSSEICAHDRLGM